MTAITFQAYYHFRMEQLRARELQVARMVAKGMETPAIAKELDIAIGTVKSHMQRVYARLGITGGRPSVQLILHPELLDVTPMKGRKRAVAAKEPQR